MQQWNIPDYQGVKGRFLSPSGVKEMNCHYTVSTVLDLLLKVSEPTDLDKMQKDVAKLIADQPENLSTLEQITTLPFLYGQDGYATKFRELANGGFQIDWVGGLPGGDWDTLSYPNRGAYIYQISGTDITSSQIRLS